MRDFDLPANDRTIHPTAAAPDPSRRPGPGSPVARRALLLGSAGIACVGILHGNAARALPIPGDRRLTFRILRKGSVIGAHSVNFGQDDDGLTVSIAMDVAVGIGPLILFRYHHNATERWRGNRLMFMQTETNDDGTRDWVTARRDSDGIAIEGSRDRPYTAPPDAMPGSHWNPQMLRVPVINTQTGRLLRPRVTLVDEEKVALGSGTTVAAKHFSVRGDANIDTWYDASPSWVALRFIAHEGSEIRYERI